MWSIDFYSPRCEPRQSLRSKGLYNRVRLVLDLKDYYYLAREYMDCKVCHRTFISWDSRILEQLGDGVRARFSVVLTHNYACDQAVISLLRACTVGNSSTAFQHNLWEVHSEEWLRKQLLYLTDCQRHQKSLQTMKLPQPLYQETTHFPNFPTASWLLSTYVLDVWSRLHF